MPVRSLRSSLLVWPKRAEVDSAVRQWAVEAAATQPDLRRLGYFGSYARGDWGVGSDLDLVAIIAPTAQPPERRALSWDTTSLPVPADLLIYTEPEWQRLQASGSRFAQVLAQEVVWVWPVCPPGALTPDA